LMKHSTHIKVQVLEVRHRPKLIKAQSKEEIREQLGFSLILNMELLGDRPPSNLIQLRYQEISRKAHSNQLQAHTVQLDLEISLMTSMQNNSISEIKLQDQRAGDLEVSE